MQDKAKSATRLYVPDNLAAGALISLSEAQAHQLRAVLRLQSGATIALFNGRDGEWLGTATIDKRHALVRLTELTRPQQAAIGAALAFAPIKPERMGWLVEKATELGVVQLLPVITARTQNGRFNPDRLAHTAREAAEQCRRLDVPLIAQPQSLAAFLASWDTAKPLLFCAEVGQAAPLTDALATLNEPPTFLIGPEGGFTPEEFALLRAQSQITPVSLGPLILRAETAAIAALACWQARTAR